MPTFHFVANPWWAVDLGAALSVLGILFTNRVPDLCGKNGVELVIDSGRYSVEEGRSGRWIFVLS